jgi:hypothetical protein
MNNLKKLTSAGLMGLMLSAGVAIADDSELKATTDTSRNPITGTVTVKKTYKNKKDNANGETDSQESKETTKYKTNGTVEKKKETETNQAGE